MIVTYEDVARSFEGVMPTDQEYVTAKIEEATRLLYARCPRTRNLVEDGDTEASDLARDIIIRAVLRVIRAGDSVMKSETEGNYSYTRDALSSSGNLWFPDADLAALGCGSRGGALGSARVSSSTPYAAPQRRRVLRGGWW